MIMAKKIKARHLSWILALIMGSKSLAADITSVADLLNWKCVQILHENDSSLDMDPIEVFSQASKKSIKVSIKDCTSFQPKNQRSGGCDNYLTLASLNCSTRLLANHPVDKTAVMIPQGEDFSSLESELNLADAPPSSFWIASSNKEGNFTVNRAQYFPRDGRLVTEKVSLQKKKDPIFIQRS